MLQKLNHLFDSLPVRIVFGILVLIVFLFFGIEGYFSQQNQTWVAKVDNHEISQQDFQNSFNQYRQQQLAQPGNTMDASDFEKPEVKRAALDRLINQQLLLNLNEKLGVVVPDSAVRAQIEQVPQFQVDGHFSPDAYLAMLSAAGQTTEQYQDTIRTGLAVSQLPEPIVNTAFATGAEVDAYLRLRMQTRDFHYVELPLVQPAGANVGEDDIAAWYKSHQKDFMAPEQVSLHYIEVNAADMKAAAPADESALKALYEKEKARFGAPEEREAAHILIAVPKNATPAQQKAALAKAQQVAKLAQAPGAAFAKLAQQYSDDLGSKNQGGDLGWLQKGDTDPAFESALFSLAKGQISAPVLSPEGYHIIDLEDVRGGQVKPFEQVRDQLAAEAEKNSREGEFSDIAGKLTDMVYQDPSSLEPAAKALGLTVQSTPLFPRSGASSGIAANPAVAKAAFSDQVLAQGNTSDPIDLGKNHIVVIHVMDHEPAKAKPLATVREAVRADILDARAEAASKQQADALYAQLQKTDDLDGAAKSANQPAKSATAVGRDSTAFDPQLIEAVFRLPRPATGKLDSVLVPLEKGRYAVAVLNAVHDGDASSLPKPQRDMLRTQMGQVSGAMETDELVAALHAKAKVEVAANRMQ
ncbi:MAG TPA: SurA N-terminal domain-containing protein [Rhodanobacteraceae bacterium]|nr:SurA N-terminal domain-containing protein [Rhodanobacteraceae bacterium]